MSGSLHMIDVVQVGWHRQGDEAGRLTVRSYPVTYVRDNRTGVILWTVEWGSGDVEKHLTATGKSGVEDLAQQAAGLKGPFESRGQTGPAIQRILGSSSRPLLQPPPAEPADGS